MPDNYVLARCINSGARYLFFWLPSVILASWQTWRQFCHVENIFLSKSFLHVPRSCVISILFGILVPFLIQWLVALLNL
jgi:hypothetical protein